MSGTDTRPTTRTTRPCSPTRTPPTGTCATTTRFTGTPVRAATPTSSCCRASRTCGMRCATTPTFSSASRHHVPQRTRRARPRADDRHARPARAHPAARSDRVGVHAASRRGARGRAARVRARSHRPDGDARPPTGSRSTCTATSRRRFRPSCSSVLLGIPEADRHRFDPWVAGLVRLQNAGFAIDGHRRRRGVGRRDVRVLLRRHRCTARRTDRRPARRADRCRDRRATAHRLGHPRLLLRHGRRRQRHDRQPDLARRDAARCRSREPRAPGRARRS